MVLFIYTPSALYVLPHALPVVTMQTLFVAYYLLVACLSIIFVPLLALCHRGDNSTILTIIKVQTSRVLSELGATTCAICLGEHAIGDTIVKLPCHNTHVYHTECTKEWFRNNAVCPTCRTPVQGIDPDNLGSRNLSYRYRAKNLCISVHKRLI